MGSVYKRALRSGGETSTWWISYYTGTGERIRESAGTENKKQAEAILKEREGRVATGQPVFRNMDKILYQEVRSDLVTYYTVNATRDLAEANARLAHLDRHFANYRVAGITSPVIEGYQQARLAQQAARGTINRETATLSKMLRLAYRNGKLARLPMFERLEEPPARSGFVTREQFEDIARHLPTSLRVGALIAFTFGWRLREVLGLKRRHLDLQAGTLRLDPGSTKNKDGRVAHLTPELRAALVEQVARVQALERTRGEIIATLLPHLEGHLAGRPMIDIRKAWQRACRRAGRPGTRFHDLRRSAVRNLEAAGVSRSVAMKITGHRTASVYARYAIVSDADLQEAASKLAARAAR